MCVMRILLSIVNTGPGEGPCRDHDGNVVSEGEWLTPGKDPCVVCKCVGGRPGECVVSKTCAPNGDRSTESPVDTDVSETPAASPGSTYHLPIAFALFCLTVHYLCYVSAACGLCLIWQLAIVFTCNILSSFIWQISFSLSLSLSLCVCVCVCVSSCYAPRCLSYSSHVRVLGESQTSSYFSRFLPGSGLKAQELLY